MSFSQLAAQYAADCFTCIHVIIPILFALIVPSVLSTGSLTAISVSSIAVYASLFIMSHAIGMRSMARMPRSLVMIIPTVLIADAAVMLIGIHGYGQEVASLTLRGS
ncbi:hypothetical protein PaecuDRAFT_4148 [Paenibacillus curdlanolyticus YK9]|uniref:Uncharacterized protein n=1 Tax=Paenibacillus curdlanolyticus YK9 TaxID=717606 RepID=E0IEQ7_9BACL|nr:hypothetical protein [Paenibacillus curdlanolyticus]EFM09145.1 hypothetical protein PaecuDRAFT_4148 [Paenibacillus curdlanolyticus YK9]